MKKIISILLTLLSLTAFSQINEGWVTLSLSGKLKNNNTVVIEVEQRYNITHNYSRYTHYDIGYVMKIDKSSKIGIYFREIYEIKNGNRVGEWRPHIDYIYEYKSILARLRVEYQFKEKSENLFRLRTRIVYQSSFYKNYNPYISNEMFFNKFGFIKNRFNIGITMKYKNIEIQPGYLIEDNKGISWINNNVIWINTKFKF